LVPIELLKDSRAQKWVEVARLLPTLAARTRCLHASTPGEQFEMLKGYPGSVGQLG